MKILILTVLFTLISLFCFCSFDIKTNQKVENKYLQIEFDDSLQSKIISKFGDQEIVSK